MNENPRGFASDNFAGAHPDVLAAVAAANDGHVPAYGDDPYTAAAPNASASTSANGAAPSSSSTAAPRTSSR